jgi:hypothetical protein
MESAPLSDVGSHSGAGGDVDKGSHVRSYYFGPSTMTVGCIQGMIDNSYFTEGMGREPGDETILEQNSDELWFLKSSLLLAKDASTPFAGRPLAEVPGAVA